jgi:hypothetical protein
MFRLKILFRSPTHTTMKRKTIGMVLLGLAAFALVGSGAAKLFAEPEAGMPARFLAMKSSSSLWPFPKRGSWASFLPPATLVALLPFSGLLKDRHFRLLALFLTPCFTLVLHFTTLRLLMVVLGWLTNFAHERFRADLTVRPSTPRYTKRPSGALLMD